MDSNSDSLIQSKHTHSRELSLPVAHRELQAFVDELLSDFQESERVSRYFVTRVQHEQAIKQDLLPLLVYLAVSDQEWPRAMPLVAAWALCLAASHLLDEAQDGGQFQAVNDGVVVLGMANVALADLDVDEDTLRDILDAMGRVAALGASAQSNELRKRHIGSRTEYFRTIIGKAASIISTGAWMGGRMATEEGNTLALLKEFGLALGIAIQISDDCLDLAEDLTKGIYTLPVIEGLSLTSHPQHAALERLLVQNTLDESSAEEVVLILERMGAVDVCRRMAGIYQAQAAAVFDPLPGLSTYFANYVTQGA